MNPRVSLSLCFSLLVALSTQVAQAQTPTAPAQTQTSATTPAKAPAPTSTTATPALTPEQAAIRKHLDDESTAFYANAYDAYVKLWSDAPYASYTFPVGNNQYQRFLGENVKKGFQSVMTGKPSGRTSTKTNLTIRVNGNTASAIYDDEVKDAAGKRLTIFHCQRYLERENGQWKIVTASTFL